MTRTAIAWPDGDRRSFLVPPGRGLSFSEDIDNDD